MRSTLYDRTVLPHHSEEIAKVRDFFERTHPGGGPATFAFGDDSVSLPAELVRGMRLLVQALADGSFATIERLNQTLTTQQAAELLEISRPTLIKLLDEGWIPYETTEGGHRRIRQSGILEFLRKERQAMRRGIEEIVRISEELGLYDDDFPLEMPDPRH